MPLTVRADSESHSTIDLPNKKQSVVYNEQTDAVRDFALLQDKYDKLNTKYTTLEKENKQLHGTNTKKAEQITKLTIDNNILQSTVTKLTNENSTLQATTVKLQSELSSAKLDVEERDMDITALQQRFEYFKHKYNIIEDDTLHTNESIDTTEHIDLTTITTLEQAHTAITQIENRLTKTIWDLQTSQTNVTNITNTLRQCLNHNTALTIKNADITESLQAECIRSEQLQQQVYALQRDLRAALSDKTTTDTTTPVSHHTTNTITPSQYNELEQKYNNTCNKLITAHEQIEKLNEQITALHTTQQAITAEQKQQIETLHHNYQTTMLQMKSTHEQQVERLTKKARLSQ